MATALQGSQVKPQIIVDPDGTPATIDVGIVQSMSPSASTQTVSQKGLSGVSLDRVSQHEFNWGWEGLVTAITLFDAGLPDDSTLLPPALDVYMHTEKLTDARVATMKITGSESEPLKYSFDGQFLAHSTITAAATYTPPDFFFVYSDATITFGDESDEIKSFELTISRNLEPIYGTSLAPTDFTIGTTSYSGTIEVAASTMAQALSGASAADAATFGFEISFVYPLDTDETIVMTGTGAVLTGSDGSIDPDSSLSVKLSFKFSGFSVAAS